MARDLFSVFGHLHPQNLFYGFVCACSVYFHVVIVDVSEKNHSSTENCGLISLSYLFFFLLFLSSLCFKFLHEMYILTYCNVSLISENSKAILKKCKIY